MEQSNRVGTELDVLRSKTETQLEDDADEAKLDDAIAMVSSKQTQQHRIKTLQHFKLSIFKLLRASVEEFEQWKEQVSHLWRLAREHLRQVSPTQLYAAAAIVVFPTVVFLSRLLRRAKSNTIVLTGLSGSGKTVLFYQLRDGSTHQGTVTSMEPNVGTFILHGETTKKRKIRPLHIVDVPGHSCLRPKLDEYLPQAAGIVFVIDALDFLPNCRAASEYLYDLLTKGSVVRKKIPPTYSLQQNRQSHCSYQRVYPQTDGEGNRQITGIKKCNISS